MADSLPHRGHDHVWRSGRPKRLTRRAQRGPDRLGDERLAVHVQRAVHGFRAAEQRAGGRHARLGGGLSPADALHLSVALRAPAQLDRRVVDRQRHAVGTKPLSQAERKVEVHDRLAYPDPRHRPASEFQPHLVGRHPALEQLVEAEIGDVDQLSVGADSGEAVALEQRRLDERAAVELRVHQRIDDHDRNLVPQRRAALGVAIEEKVRHSAD